MIVKPERTGMTADLAQLKQLTTKFTKTNHDGNNFGDWKLP